MEGLEWTQALSFWGCGAQQAFRGVLPWRGDQLPRDGRGGESVSKYRRHCNGCSRWGLLFAENTIENRQFYRFPKVSPIVFRVSSMYIWFSSLAELKGVDDGGGGSFFGASSGQKFRQHLDLDSFWVDDLQLSGIFDQETVDIWQTIQVWAARLTSSNPRWDGTWGLGVPLSRTTPWVCTWMCIP